jgi:hypothetical protein
VGVESVVPVDLDGDGDQDLAAASVLDNSVIWLENLDGAGGFGDKHVIDDSLNGAIHLEAADLNGDQRQDLLVSGAGGATVAWYANLGQPQMFGAAQVISSNLTRTEASVAADLDGDGDLDVVATAVYGDANDVVWFENLDGKGAFGAARVIQNNLQSPRDIVAADLDGDDDTDVAIVSIFDNRIVWFENGDGKGTFLPQSLISSSNEWPVAIDAGDVNGDGDLDLLVGAMYDNTTMWLENVDGQGTFGPVTLIGQESQWPEAVELADLDGDGDLDALVSSILDDSISWHENLSGNGDFGPRHVIDDQAKGAGDVAVADVDGDGDMDVIGAHYDTSRIVWYRQIARVPGDVTGDSKVTADDVDLLCQAVHSGSQNASFDLTADGLIDMQDFDALIGDVLQTSGGDANLDGVFNSSDLLQVFVPGQYEDAIVGNSTWGTGDWNCDAEFDSGDLIAAFQAGTYSAFATGSRSLPANWTDLALANDDQRAVGPRPKGRVR